MVLHEVKLAILFPLHFGAMVELAAAQQTEFTATVVCTNCCTTVFTHFSKVCTYCLYAETEDVVVLYTRSIWRFCSFFISEQWLYLRQRSIQNSRYLRSFGGGKKIHPQTVQYAHTLQVPVCTHCCTVPERRKAWWYLTRGQFGRGVVFTRSPSSLIT